MSAGTQKSPTMGTEFSPTLLLLLCHKISSSPFLSAAPETGVSLKEGPAVAAQKGCDGGSHMSLRPHGERPAAGNPRVGEGLGGRTEAQGGDGGEPVLPGGRFMARPFDEQPLFGTGCMTVDVAVGRANPDTGEARPHGAACALTPCHVAPGDM